MSSANTFGSRLKFTSFGESHGLALGVVIDGVPAGVKWNEKVLLKEMSRRRPGQSKIVSARAEMDSPEVLSGVYQGKTLGTPIAIIVRNHDARSEDYKEISKKPRAGHADDVWQMKFGHTDPRGGGRSSGRETLARVIAGSVAQMILAHLAPKLRVRCFASAIGPFKLNAADLSTLSKAKQMYFSDQFPARFPSSSKSNEVEKLLLKAKEEGKSYGGVADLWVDGVPKGLGQPVFHKIKADLALALMSVGATAGFEVGDGFSVIGEEGSKFHSLKSDQSKYGGQRGGITTGERLILRVGFKPTSSVLDVAKKGRHDPCIVPRAIPVLEAMTYFTLVDHLLWARTDRI